MFNKSLEKHYLRKRHMKFYFIYFSGGNLVSLPFWIITSYWINKSVNSFKLFTQGVLNNYMQLYINFIRQFTINSPNISRNYLLVILLIMLWFSMPFKNHIEQYIQIFTHPSLDFTEEKLLSIKWTTCGHAICWKLR